jgi:predicted extracellular nuclease
MNVRIRFWNVLMIVVLLAGAVFVTPAQPVKAANDLRISQVFGGGGSTGSPYTNDFIEIFNGGTAAISLNGLSIQYASASGTGFFGATTTQLTELPNVMLQPGQYFLIQGASGASGSPLPTPDVIDATPINLSQTNGKVIIATGIDTLGCNGGTTPCSPSQLARIIDLVGYGAADFYEGSAAAPILSASLAALRAGGGCTDTDINSANFTAVSPAARNTSSPTNICAVDTAPTLSSTIPANGATGVALDANLSLTFSEAVTVTDPWYSISCSTSGTHTAAVSGGPSIFTLNPDTDFANSETCTVTLTPANIVDQDGTPDALTGTSSFSFTTLAPTACGLTYTDIHDIQGALDTPALTGVQTTEGVVTADYQSGGFNGFYLQAIPGTEDANPATSEGVFVYNTSFPVNSGDRVRLTGTVTNYTGGGFSSMTEITTLTALEVCSTGISVTPTLVNLPESADPSTYLERYEGMLVTFPETLVVQQNYFQGRYGQLTLGDGRLFQINNFTKGGDPNPQLSMIALDDGTTTQNRNPIPYLAVDGAVRAGNTVTGGLTGVLDNGQINTSTSATTWPMAYYRLQPVDPASVTFNTTVNARSATPPAVGGRLMIVGSNLLNYFTTLDMAPFRSTPPYDGGSNTPRGADSAIEFTRQQAKIVAMLAGMHADVFGLTEIEAWDGANGGLGAGQALVDALNAVVGAGTYAVIADPVLGHFDPLTDLDSDYIQNAIIYNTLTVSPVGASMSLDDIIFDRSPFAQEFEEISTGEQFVVLVNHFKSKSSCPAAGDPNADQGDGQGCWNLKRQQQSTALLNFINTSLVPLDPDVLVVGDYNAYGAEDPITVLTNGGLVNQVAANVPAAERYSYVFDGTAGYLDHALSTPSVTPQITDVAFWHINADEPSVIDYNTEFKAPNLCSGVPCSPDLYQPHAFRATDHDPVMVGLSLGEALALTDMDLQQSTDTITWTDVPGSFAGGYNMVLDPAVEWYYLDAANLVSNRPLANGLYPFFINTHPAGFFEYWATRGVVSGATGWQGVMWNIINGTAPIFLLQVNGPNFMLVDGLQYLASSGALINHLRIDGTYWPGAYTFVGDVADAGGFEDTVEVGISFNDLPVAQAQAVTTAEDTPVLITLTGVDHFGTALTYTVVDSPAHGVLSGTAPNLTYTPVLDFNGTDSFTFTVSDGTLTSLAATVAITVTPVNDSPVAVDDAYTVAEDGTLTVVAPGVMANDVDVDGDVMTVAILTDVAHGTLMLYSDGSFVYTPDTGFSGVDTFEYQLSTYPSGLKDTWTDTATVTITVTPVNHDPIAVDDAYSVMEGQTLDVPAPGVLANDVDVDGDAMTASILIDVAHGTLTLFENGSFIYTPDAGFYGVDTFEYQLTTYPVGPLAPWTDTAVVTITVTPLPRIWMPVILR